MGGGQVHARICRGLIVRRGLLASCLCILSPAACVLPEVFASNEPEQAAGPMVEEGVSNGRENRVHPTAPAAESMQEQAVGTMQQSVSDAGIMSSGQSVSAVTGAAGSTASSSGAAASAGSSSAELVQLGAACPAGGPSECISGKCADGICCQVGSCDVCQRCGASGMCEPVRNAMVGTCSGKLHCDAQAKCVGGIGAVCGGGNACEDGTCLDSVCCDAASCGTCSTCNVFGSEGSCISVRGNDDMDSCYDSQTCDSAGVCDQLAIDNIRGSGNGSRFGDSEFSRVAQSFSLKSAVRLVEIHVDLTCEDEKTQLTAELRAMTTEGASVPSDLVISRLRDAGIGQSGLRMLVTESAVALNPGQSVALVLGTSGGACAFRSVGSSADGMPFAERSGSAGWVSSAGFGFRALVR